MVAVASLEGRNRHLAAHLALRPRLAIAAGCLAPARLRLCCLVPHPLQRPPQEECLYSAGHPAVRHQLVAVALAAGYSNRSHRLPLAVAAVDLAHLAAVAAAVVVVEGWTRREEGQVHLHRPLPRSLAGEEAVPLVFGRDHGLLRQTVVRQRQRPVPLAVLSTSPLPPLLLAVATPMPQRLPCWPVTSPNTRQRRR